MQRLVIYGSQHLIAQEAAGDVVEFIEGKFKTLDAALWLTDLDNVSPKSMKLLLESLLGFDRSYTNILYLDASVKPVARVSRLPIGASDTFLSVINEQIKADISRKKRIISRVHINPYSGEPFIIIAVPAFNVMGDYSGCMIAEVNLKYIWDLVGNLKVGENGLAYVVNRTGGLIAFRDTARVLKGENVAKLRPVHDFIRATRTDHAVEVSTYRGIDGTLVVGTYVPLGIPDWAVVTETPLTEAYSVVIRNGLTTLLITLFVAFIAGVMGIYLARWISVPLSHLTEIATRIASGDRTLHAEVVRPKEAASLASAFNSMTTQLRQILENLERQVIDTGKAESSLRRANETLQGVIDNSPLAIVMLDINKRIMLWNRAAETIYGWRADEIIGATLPILGNGNGEEFSALSERVIRGEVFTDMETEHVRKDGSAISVSASVSPIRGTDGDVYAFIIIAADITERKLA
ncbi:MAG TPA: PAS domain S-box protein, partial [Spirochaetota bacterium]|nr:PAS domain S-box protein [Spirochaetota bacterium]